MAFFYRTIMSDQARFLPIVYDPTIGEACLKFGHIYRQPHGMFYQSAVEGPLTGSASTSGDKKTRDAFYHCIPGCSRIPVAKMEAEFLGLLDDLRPRAEAWRLLQAVILDVWTSEQQSRGAAKSAANRHVGELKGKLGRLEHAFIFDRAIDESRYRLQRVKLREEIALAKMEATDAAQLEGDIEALLAFADHALNHASAIWTSAASSEERIKFQWTIVPTGCKWSPALGTFERPVSCLEFFELQPTRRQHGKVVEHSYPTWNRISSFLRHIHAGRRAA